MKNFIIIKRVVFLALLSSCISRGIFISEKKEDIVIQPVEVLKVDKKIEEYPKPDDPLTDTKVFPLDMDQHGAEVMSDIVTDVPPADINIISALTNVLAVEIKNGSTIFSPAQIKINTGDSVKWINNDFTIDAHIFQSVPGTNLYDKDKDEIPVINLYGGQIYEQRFERIGIYPYFCFVHDGMRGEIVVVKNGQTIDAMKSELASQLNHRKVNMDTLSKSKLLLKEMVLIPAGKFIMGTPNEPTEGPVRQENLPDFYIDKYEVTNEEYEEFVDRTGYKPEGDFRSKYKKGREKHPVSVLTYNDAVSYANWAGKRLPTEAEWEKAARGADHRLWPWGNEFDNEITNVFGPDPYPETSPVGSFPKDISPYGVNDMGGNVSEWTSDKYLPYQGSAAANFPDFSIKKMTVRGGGFNTVYEEEARTHTRKGNHTQNAMPSIGFRLVKDK